MTAPAGSPARPPATAQRLIATLGGFGALAGLLIFVVFTGTQPRIQANKAAALAAAINEVLAVPDRYDTLYVAGAALSRQLPAGANAETAEVVYLGWRGDDPIGFAIVANGPGFQDNIRVIFGYNPHTAGLLGMKVLESKETPGLGDRIEKDSAFVAGFGGAAAPLRGVKAGASTGALDEVDMITGATISSRAIIEIINERVAALDPLLDAYDAGSPR
jgi:electron transport complex protein RnfG